MVVIDDFETGAFHSGWYDTNLVTVGTHTSLGGYAANHPYDAASRMLGGSGLPALPTEGSLTTWTVFIEWQYGAEVPFDICATYSAGAIQSGYRCYTPPNSRAWHFRKYTGGTADWDEQLGVARLDSPSAVVATLHWQYDAGGQHTFWWTSPSSTFENPMGTVTATNVDNAYTSGDIGILNPAASNPAVGEITTESLGVPVTGTVTVDGTPLEGARIIGVNDTQGIVEDVTTTAADGTYTLTMTPGDVAHILMEYEGATVSHNDESKPFVVVSE